MAGLLGFVHVARRRSVFGGQLAVRALVPLLAVCGAGATLLPAGSLIVPAVQFLVLVALGLASAEHAKRLVEPTGPWQKSPGIQTTAAHRRPRGRSISLSIRLDVPRPADEIWRRVADLPAFLTIDPFHANVTLMRSSPAAGVDVVLEHRAFGISLRRYGRLLYWRVGRGYALSDLSARGANRGFPHVFFVSINATDDAHTRLTIDVRGKWTSPWIPVWLGMPWLRYVMAEHARLLRKAL